MTGMKMITCCYCGARNVMRMGKGTRIALSCLTCGAPVRKMEVIKPNDPPPSTSAPVPKKINRHKRPPHFEAAKKRKKHKKRKSLIARIWDEVDDVFDFDDWLDFD